MKKNTICIIILTVGLFFVFIGLLLMSFNNNSKELNGSILNYKNIMYSIPLDDYCSCLSFNDNNKFSEYDCDSEPTSMPFTGEYYDKYVIFPKTKLVIFTGNLRLPVIARIKEWNENKLVIKVFGINQNRRCSKNGNNVYEYYSYELTRNGLKMKRYLNSLNKKNDLVIESWINNGSQMCNKNNKDRCSDATIVSTEDILNKIDDNKKYRLRFFRDKSGNIESVSLSKKDF